MNSNKFEEVRRRKAKAGPGWLNPFQKVLLLAGGLALFFAIGLGLRLAPFLAAGVAAGTLLVFLIFRNLKRKKERKNKAAPEETPSGGEKALEPEPISYRADVKIIGDSPQVISKQTNWDALQESISLEPAGAITILETSAVEEKGLSAEEFSGEGVLTQIPEKVAMLEEKVINLEDMLLSLNDRVGDVEDRQLKLGP